MKELLQTILFFSFIEIVKSSDGNSTEFIAMRNFNCTLETTYCVYSNYYEKNYLTSNDLLIIPLFCTNASQVGYNTSFELKHTDATLFGYHRVYGYFYHNCTSDGSVYRKNQDYGKIIVNENVNFLGKHNLLDEGEPPAWRPFDWFYRVTKLDQTVLDWYRGRPIQKDKLPEPNVDWQIISEKVVYAPPEWVDPWVAYVTRRRDRD